MAIPKLVSNIAGNNKVSLQPNSKIQDKKAPNPYQEKNAAELKALLEKH